MKVANAGAVMGLIRLVAIAALPFLATLAPGQAQADDDEQALRLRDTVADPSVPLAWDRRHHPETWRYRTPKRHHASRCGKRYYWNGGKCVLKRRYR